MVLTSSCSVASGINPTQTMLSNKTNLLLLATEKSRMYVSGTAGSRSSSDALGLFFTHSRWMWALFLGRLSLHGSKRAPGSNRVMRSSYCVILESERDSYYPSIYVPRKDCDWLFGVICLPLAQSQSPGGEMLQLASLDPVPTLVVYLNDSFLRITELGRAAVPKEGMQA